MSNSLHVLGIRSAPGNIPESRSIPEKRQSTERKFSDNVFTRSHRGRVLSSMRSGRACGRRSARAPGRLRLASRKEVTSMLLNRDDWYDTSRDLDWTLSDVEEDAAFPAEWTGAGDI